MDMVNLRTAVERMDREVAGLAAPYPVLRDARKLVPPTEADRCGDTSLASVA